MFGNGNHIILLLRVWTEVDNEKNHLEVFLPLEIVENLQIHEGDPNEVSK